MIKFCSCYVQYCRVVQMLTTSLLLFSIADFLLDFVLTAKSIHIYAYIISNFCKFFDVIFCKYIAFFSEDYC